MATSKYQAPKGIAAHPGVQECEAGAAGGADEYRHEVWLKEGWSFENGRTAGCRGGFFNSVSDFLYANPVQG